MIVYNNPGTSSALPGRKPALIELEETFSPHIIETVPVSLLYHGNVLLKLRTINGDGFHVTSSPIAISG